MGYSFHKYWGQTDISTIQSYINLRNNYGVPLWMGESGENSNHWYYEVFKLLEENNIGWNFWTHKKVDKITSPYSALVTPQYQVIIDYLRGVAGQPDPNIAGMGLTSFANSLKIENCITRPGVIASLTDPDYGEISKPYITHSIPGTIPAAYYDIGARGLSYSDSDYWNDGDGGYNDGWVFRNDGVDVEGSDDDPNIPYTVGWTEAGEWLGYTIEDVLPGTYDVSFSISAPNAGGIFYAQLSGQNLGVIDVPSTGGWYNWEDIPSQRIEITEGEKFLKIQIVQAGFNIQSVTFDQVLSIDNQNLNPDSFFLGKPYPNPFNPSVEMNLLVDNSGTYQVNIHNIKGELINNWDVNFTQKGNHIIQWNAMNYSGSLVPSGVFFISVTNQNKSKQRKVLLLR